MYIYIRADGDLSHHLLLGFFLARAVQLAGLVLIAATLLDERGLERPRGRGFHLPPEVGGWVRVRFGFGLMVDDGSVLGWVAGCLTRGWVRV